MYLIDRATYSKTAAIPYNPEKDCGYQPRPAGRLAPRSILVHTTNGRAGTTLAQEARYIQTSLAISSHYLIGKGGEVIMFLDPRLWIAYHAGCVKATVWSNAFAIGIEMHNTPVEGHITTAQFNALDWLVRNLMSDFSILNTNIETHRNVAVFCKPSPKAGQLGRKIDPSGFPDNEFYAWRNNLIAADHNQLLTTYKVVNPRGVNVRQSPQVNDHNVAGVLYYGDTFQSDVLKQDELNQSWTGAAGTSKQWAHIYSGRSMGKPVDQLGFVSLSNLKMV